MGITKKEKNTEEDIFTDFKESWINGETFKPKKSLSDFSGFKDINYTISFENTMWIIFVLFIAMLTCYFLGYYMGKSKQQKKYCYNRTNTSICFK